MFRGNKCGLKTRRITDQPILHNPTEDCIAPKPRKVDMQILPSESIGTYLEAAQRCHLLPIFYLELVSGLRKGELVALLWDDVDTEHNMISVSRQLVRNPDGSLELTQPKTETSIRQVSIPQEAVDLPLQEHNLHSDNPYLVSA